MIGFILRGCVIQQLNRAVVGEVQERVNQGQLQLGLRKSKDCQTLSPLHNCWIMLTEQTTHPTCSLSHNVQTYIHVLSNSVCTVVIHLGRNVSPRTVEPPLKWEKKYIYIIKNCNTMHLVSRNVFANLLMVKNITQLPT